MKIPAQAATARELLRGYAACSSALSASRSCTSSLTSRSIASHPSATNPRSTKSTSARLLWIPHHAGTLAEIISPDDDEGHESRVRRQGRSARDAGPRPLRCREGPAERRVDRRRGRRRQEPPA